MLHWGGGGVLVWVVIRLVVTGRVGLVCAVLLVRVGPSVVSGIQCCDDRQGWVGLSPAVILIHPHAMNQRGVIAHLPHQKN